MADVKVALSGTEFVELRVIVGMATGKMSKDEARSILAGLGYDLNINDGAYNGIDQTLCYIAERLIERLG